MSNRILDKKLLLKIATRLNKRNVTDVNVLVSKKANKFGISPQAALVIIAKNLNIGTASYQKKLDHNKQAEIRDALVVKHGSNKSDFVRPTIRYSNVKSSKKEEILKLAPEFYGIGINLKALWSKMFKND
ncbi:hypothetical protein A2799_04575 [Candidatus Roizmanbacteria bacterium RIFCSPHIGHO2_01_FULL_39_24]|uniref:Uncharacterized protein n=1 Tax=Candidatus Roizmanbacteria bacterium RIFCSPHIGHO2_01_FULL_39_24 TaxID=1802032 RepID=A0A1F7GLU6_9BACT|nr:MAG: hypothetical protein A2799_04575 [Candidatus Roizmanbacteria bacterium RIFCSPHIGHO2_01_FULL_39_24]OGK49523.1 MAG: hypothetical protein A3A56_03485 [Candidatus Roizmanbacteria bacterium RIFCSPLOWO2_01_FULL_40_32]